MAGARARSPDLRRAVERCHPASTQAVSTAAQSRSHSVLVRTKSLIGNTAGLRLKRASGPLQWESAFQAEPERSGIRTHDPMIMIHLLYPTELSFVVP